MSLLTVSSGTVRPAWFESLISIPVKGNLSEHAAVSVLAW